MKYLYPENTDILYQNLTLQIGFFWASYIEWMICLYIFIYLNFVLFKLVHGYITLFISHFYYIVFVRRIDIYYKS